jgi:TPR repeat protein
MSGGVFICYRREETGFAARAIHDRVVQRLERENVFLDVDNIDLGVDWFSVLTERVGACDALVAVMGKNWVSSADKDGLRRLDDPDDFVRIEIEAALQRNVRVIPVLVDGAAMPKANELPESLKGLARRQGTEVSPARFEADVEKLTHALVSILDERRRRDAAEAEAARQAEEERRAQKVVAAERAAREERERQEAAEAARAEEAQRLAEAEGAWQAEEKRRSGDAADADRAASEGRAAAEAAGRAEQGRPLAGADALRMDQGRRNESAGAGRAARPLAEVPQSDVSALEHLRVIWSSARWRWAVLGVVASAAVLGLTRLHVTDFGSRPVEKETVEPIPSASPGKTIWTSSDRKPVAPPIVAAETTAGHVPTSAELVDTPSDQVSLAERYLSSGKYDDALNWYRKAAGRGSAEAQFAVGNFYRYGLGSTVKDSATAMAWYEKAAAQGNANAQAALNVLQATGQSVAGQSQPNTPGDQVSLAERYLSSGKYDDALNWYRKAAERGSAEAQFAVGNFYRYGLGSTVKDSTMAIAWYENAAAHGNTNAQAALNVLRPGEPQSPTLRDQIRLADQRRSNGDYAGALALYRQAADQGSAEAKFAIGNFYRYGLGGVEQNLAAAIGWYRQAATQGDINAQAALNALQAKP